jgi:hypothetical protein
MTKATKRPSEELNNLQLVPHTTFKETNCTCNRNFQRINFPPTTIHHILSNLRYGIEVIKVSRYIHSIVVTILLVTKATHNFISKQVIEKSGVFTSTIEGVSVKLAIS